MRGFRRPRPGAVECGNPPAELCRFSGESHTAAGGSPFRELGRHGLPPRPRARHRHQRGVPKPAGVRRDFHWFPRRLLRLRRYSVRLLSRPSGVCPARSCVVWFLALHFRRISEHAQVRAGRRTGVIHPLGGRPLPRTTKAFSRISIAKLKRWTPLNSLLLRLVLSVRGGTANMGTRRRDSLLERQLRAEIRRILALLEHTRGTRRRARLVVASRIGASRRQAGT